MKSDNLCPKRNLTMMLDDHRNEKKTSMNRIFRCENVCTTKTCTHES